MASMAAACRVTIRGFDSVSLPPRPTSSIHKQIPSFSRRRNHLSTFSTNQRGVGHFKIQAMSSDSHGSQLKENVKKILSENPVVVYSKTWCPYSTSVKSLFEKIGVEPYVVELDELGSEGSQIQNTLETLTGQRTVPNVFIGGKHIGGCSDTVELHQRGELEPLLLESGAKK